MSAKWIQALLIAVALVTCFVGAVVWSLVPHGPQGSYGLEGQYFPNLEWQGKPLVFSVDQHISSNTLKEQRAKLPDNHYSVEWTGYIDIPETDTYSFSLGSDDGSWLFIDDQLIVDNGGAHGLVVKEEDLFLQKDFHRIVIKYVQFGGAAALRVFWAQGDAEKVPLGGVFLLPLHTNEFHRIAHRFLSYWPDCVVVLCSLLGVLLCRLLLHLHLQFLRTHRLDWIKYAIISVVPGGLIVAAGLSRLGQSFVDYLLVDAGGNVSAPFERLGYALYYAVVPLLLVILVASAIAVKGLVSAKYPAMVRRLSVPDSALRVLPPLLFVAMGMNGFGFIRTPNFSGDTYYYLMPIHYLLQGQGYSLSVAPAMILPPGYGIIANILSLITNNILMAAMLVMSLSYILLILIAYYIGAVLAGRRGGFLSAFFLTFCPLILRFSFLSYISLLYMLATTLCFAVYLKILLHPPTYARSLLLGLLLGGTILIREEGLMVTAGTVSFWFLLTLLAWVKEKPFRLIRIRKHLSYPGLTLLVLVLFLLLNMWFIYSNTGRWSISQRLSGFSGKFIRAASTPSEHSSTKEQPDKRVVDYLPYSVERLSLNAKIAAKGAIHVVIHAFVPLLFILALWSVYVVKRIGSRKRVSVQWQKIPDALKTSCAFLVFMSPIVGPVIIANNPRVRYAMQNTTVFLLLLFAVCTVKLLEYMFRQNISNMLALICVLSLCTTTGLLFTESKLFKNPLLSLTNYSLTRDSLIHLRESGIPLKITDKLKPLKDRVFHYRGLEFWNELEQKLDKEELQEYRPQILQQASVVLPYTTLLDVLTNKIGPIESEIGSFERYFSNLILWLRGHYQDEIKIITSANLTKAALLMFLASGGKTAPPEEMVASISPDVALPDVVETMKRENITYFLLIDTDNFTTRMKNMLTLWENPDKAAEWGLRLVYTDPNGAQVYSLQQ